MNWLARLKKIEIVPQQDAIEPTKPGYVGFVATGMTPMQKIKGDLQAANDPTENLGRWCWPHSEAMASSEIDTFTARLTRFTDKGLGLQLGQALADKLVTRDRESDDRRLCLECFHLSGQSGKAWKCRNWQLARLAIPARDAQLSAALVCQLQRCDGFKEANI